MAKGKKATAAPKRPHVQRTVPLQRCYVAPENARFGVPEESVEELAANIETYGLLQPLTGYEDDNGDFAVCDGRRRLAALTALNERGVQPAAAAGATEWALAIPFTEIDRADALGAALSTNTERVNLGVVEEAVAFHRMALDGKPEAEIARAFGATERFVKSRMKLAGLHEPILEALRAGELPLDVAQIYAGAQMSRQERVWNKLSKDDRRRDWCVRDELKKNTLFAGDGLAKFVGEEAYVAAGGIVEHELFTSADRSRWLDPALAEKLAKEKLAAKALELEAEGFMFVEAALEIAYGKYVNGNLGAARKPSDIEKRQLADIKARDKGIDAERAAIEKAVDKRTGEKHSNDYTEAEEARLDALEAEETALAAEKQRIERALFEFDDKAKAKSGVTVTLDDDGGFVITRGVVAPRERKATPAGKAKAGKAASAKPSKPEPQAAMTNLTHEKTTRLASVIVGRALAANPQVALVALTAAMARQVFNDDLNYANAPQALTLRGAGERPGSDEFDETLLSHKAYLNERERWCVAIAKSLNTLEAEMIAKWPAEDVLALMAFCVGESVKVIEHQAAGTYKDADEPRAVLASLGKLAGAIPAAHFIPDADYFGGLSRPSLDAAAAELGLSTASAKTIGALAQLIADHAPNAAWTPPLLRTLCGVESAPAVKKAAAKKPAAKKPAAKKPAVKKAAKTKAVKKPAPKAVKKAVKKAAGAEVHK